MVVRNRGNDQKETGLVGAGTVVAIIFGVMMIFTGVTGKLPKIDLLLLTILISMEIKWRLLFILDMD